mgnify:FL=1|jgi:hypothetical protein
MVHDQASWPIISQMLPFLALSFDAASHQAVVLVSLQQELPEAIFGSDLIFLNFLSIFFTFFQF